MFRALVPAVFAAALPAQIVVNPGGGGAFTDLQAAIDASPAGSVFEVVGGTYDSLTINKSVTIVGNPRPLITSPLGAFGAQDPGITLAGTGSESLTLVNVEVSGLCGFPLAEPGPGIRGSGFAEIYIARSTIEGHVYPQIQATGIFSGARGIDIPNDPTLIWITDSVVEASDSGTDGTMTAGRVGPEAINAPFGTVVAVNSALIAGDGSDSYFPVMPTANPCPCPQLPLGTARAGEGGNVVRAAHYYRTDTSETPGVGGGVFYRDPGGPSFYASWGVQLGGTASVGPITSAGATVNVASAMKLGQPWSMQFPFAGPDGGVVIAGLPGAPLSLLGGTLFVDPTLLVAVPFAGGSTSFGLQVPNDVSLGGGRVAFQVLTSQAQWSRPVVEVVQF